MKQEETIETCVETLLNEQCQCDTYYTHHKINRFSFMGKIQGWSQNTLKQLPIQDVNPNHVQQKETHVNFNQTDKIKKNPIQKHCTAFIKNNNIEQGKNQKQGIRNIKSHSKFSQRNQKYLLPAICTIGKKNRSKQSSIKGKKVVNYNLSLKKQINIRNVSKQFRESPRKLNIENRSLALKNTKDTMSIKFYIQNYNKQQGPLSFISYPLDSFFVSEKLQKLSQVRINSYVYKYMHDPYN